MDAVYDYVWAVLPWAWCQHLFASIATEDRRLSSWPSFSKFGSGNCKERSSFIMNYFLKSFLFKSELLFTVELITENG